MIYSQVNLPPFVPSVAVENANLANPLAGQSSAAAEGYVPGSVADLGFFVGPTTYDHRHAAFATAPEGAAATGRSG